jgi:hypothetical protein
MTAPLRPEGSLEHQDPERTPEVPVGGPVAARWREGTLARAKELESLCAWVLEGPAARPRLVRRPFLGRAGSEGRRGRVKHLGETMRLWSGPKRHRRCRFSPIALSVLFVVGGLVGCSTPQDTGAPAQSSAAGQLSAGGQTPASPSPTDPGPRPNPGGSPSQSPTTTPSERGRNFGSRIIDWVSEFGLMGGAGGLKETQLNALATRTCDEIDRPQGEDVHAGTQWTGAAHACRAAFQGQSSHWRQAEDDLAKIKGRTQGFDCMDLAAYHMLDALVNAHRTAPGARIVTSSSRKGGPCPRITSVTPSHGHPGGGYPVTLTGINLPPVVEVHFGQVQLRVPTTGGSRAVVTVPAKTLAQPDSAYDSVPVWPEGWPFLGTNTALFVYDSPAPSESATPSTGTPTDTPSKNSVGSARSSSVTPSIASPPSPSSSPQ